jgi:putative component of toxin-antitoxin plasmid stabilization module
MITIREYIDLDGRSPYAKWFNRLNAPAAAKVATAIVRMEQGNFSNSKGIGEGISECRIDLDQDIVSILARMGMRSLSYLAEAQKNANKKISLTPKYFGKNISDESDRSAENGTYKRF